MKGFLIPSIQEIHLKKSLENNCLKVFLVPFLFFTMPLWAENRYLFPSDIIDQSEQANYEADRANAYAAKRKWTYPERNSLDVQPKTRQTQFPLSNRYPANKNLHLPHNKKSDYVSSRYDSFGNKLPQNSRSRQVPARARADRQGSVRYPETKSYKYQNYNSNQYQPVNKIPDQQLLRDYSAPDSRFNLHPETGRKKPYSEKENKQYGHMYPNLIYPSDVETGNRPVRQKNDAGLKKPLKQTEQPKPRVEIRYIPVPVYNVPKALSRSVLGITPGNRMPGYNRLGPDSNSSGINNPFGSQFNPLTGFGVLPGMGNPFGNVFSHYGDNSSSDWPISVPGYMMPGFSTPEMFNSVMPTK